MRRVGTAHHHLAKVPPGYFKNSPGMNADVGRESGVHPAFGNWGCRGDYRIIDEIHDRVLHIMVVWIGHRREDRLFFGGAGLRARPSRHPSFSKLAINPLEDLYAPA